MMAQQDHFTLYFTDTPSLDASIDPLNNSSIKFQCRLTLEQAALCDTLQGLIPSRTFACTMPACCKEADANYFSRLLAIYLSTNLSTNKSSDSEINFRRPTPQRFIKTLPDALRAEFDNVENLNNIRSLSHIIGLLQPPTIICKLQWAADELVNGDAPASNALINDTHDYGRQVGLLPNHTTETSSRLSNDVNSDEPVFSIISKSGVPVNLPLAIAKCSPTLSAQAQKGVMQFKLKTCEQLAVELVRNFMNLLSVEPFVVLTNKVTADIPLSALVPPSYSTLLAPFTKIRSPLHQQLETASEVLQLPALNKLVRMQKRWLLARLPPDANSISVEMVTC